MSTDAGPEDVVPADDSPATRVNKADDDAGVLAQQMQILSILASVAAQVNWLCQVVTLVTQNMPPFMRGFNAPTGPPFPTPGQPPFGSS